MKTVKKARLKKTVVVKYWPMGLKMELKNEATMKWRAHINHHHKQSQIATILKRSLTYKSLSLLISKLAPISPNPLKSNQSHSNHPNLRKQHLTNSQRIVALSTSKARGDFQKTIVLASSLIRQNQDEAPWTNTRVSLRVRWWSMAVRTIMLKRCKNSRSN